MPLPHYSALYDLLPLPVALHIFDWDDTGRLGKAEMMRCMLSMNSTLSYFGDKHLTDADVTAIIDAVRCVCVVCVCVCVLMEG